ncbi:hypothetical protein ABBQ32_002031 [Trebouxia sp. C0010 RCD-2024]
MHIMATMIGSVQVRPYTFQGPQRQRAPMNRFRWTRGSQTRTLASVKDSVKDTYTDVGKKQFELNNTTWRKGGMESEKVDGPVTRLWKFFFRPNEGYVDRFGFSVPMGPLDDRTDEQRQEARENAARNLTNIDQEERNRREILGVVMLIVVAGLAVWQLKTGASPWDRLRLLPIFFLGSAELASGLTGL